MRANTSSSLCGMMNTREGARRANVRPRDHDLSKAGVMAHITTRAPLALLPAARSSRVEFDCEVCGTHVVKSWSPSMPGFPRFCSLACKSEMQRRAKPVSREWLEQKYVTDGLDCTQIAKLVQRDPKRVWDWLKDFGIPTRPRGADATHHFRKGEPNLFAGRHHTDAAKARMSAIAKEQGRIPYDPAVGSYMKGRKGPDTPNWRGGITPERQAFYLTPEWKAAVRAVWKRADATCERCGERHNTGEHRGTFHVHHVVSFAVCELRADPDNLVLLCRPCHLFVHSRKNVERAFIGEVAA